MKVGVTELHPVRVFVAMAAVCGLLAMHGFEAALVHVDHAGPADHAQSEQISAGEHHVEHGGCSLEKPSIPADVRALGCASVWALEPGPIRPLLSGAGAWSLANRAVLTAYSILRL